MLCAAPDLERLRALKRAAVGSGWELRGGAVSADDLVQQTRKLRPDVIVLESGLGAEAVAAVKEVHPRARLVSVGSLEGADTEVSSPDGVRAAILGLPAPGGPIGR